jgi:ubiquinone biosynthesis protein UbiJ
MSPQDGVVAVAFFGAGFWVLRPIAAAVAKRIGGEHRPAPDDTGEREQILAELQDLRHEVGELAERVDFTERLLAREREVAKLDRGH